MEENSVKLENALVWVAKSVKLVIQIEKNLLLLKKHKNESSWNWKRDSRRDLQS